jgi:signal recognition particle subunit SEC65
MASGPAALTPEQRALAERLRGGDQTRSLDEWLQDALTEADAHALKTDKAIEELSLIAGEQEAAPLAARYRAVLAEPVGRRRQMLADTLMLDTVNALAAVKATAEALRSLELKAASLASMDTPQAKELAQRVAAAVAGRDAAAAQTLMKQVAAVVEQERKALAARARQSAIVNALKDLGYEVREGMQTATAQDSNVVVRRAANAEWAFR